MDDHNLVAKQEHIEAIEAELDRMKKIATHVYEEMVCMRHTSYYALCLLAFLLHLLATHLTLLTLPTQVYMRDRSDAMHTTSESTRGRRRSTWLWHPPSRQRRSSAAALHPSLIVLAVAPGTWHLAPGTWHL